MRKKVYKITKCQIVDIFLSSLTLRRQLVSILCKTSSSRSVWSCLFEQVSCFKMREIMKHKREVKVWEQDLFHNLGNLCMKENLQRIVVWGYTLARITVWLAGNVSIRKEDKLQRRIFVQFWIQSFICIVGACSEYGQHQLHRSEHEAFGG